MTNYSADNVRARFDARSILLLGVVGNDGYLSASDIAGLKLDADCVILSACNTVAGDIKRAESLSGLSRAFFYAGARLLLVSHCPARPQPKATTENRIN